MSPAIESHVSIADQGRVPGSASVVMAAEGKEIGACDIWKKQAHLDHPQTARYLAINVRGYSTYDG